MNDENTQAAIPAYDEEYFASEARFAYMRPEIDAALAAGTPADQALTPFGELPDYEKNRWINTATHIANLLQAMSASKNVEEPATEGDTDKEGGHVSEQSPTYQQVRDAYNKLETLVDAYGDRAILQLVIDNGEGEEVFLHFGNDKVAASDGKKTDALNWCGARGNMLRANRCFENDADAVSDGVKYTIIAMRNKRKKEENPFSALLGLMSGNN